ncbi:Hsp70 family protein [Phytohabitans rumicis]|uniref:Molecular chaperone DnaK n=1 Tax=Phytohabitans rumicis TaxID=1076125 RepID=A0A6V8LLR1_9ACTN|nr:Hsp70 family protein [Phytohabitans rumicis]GFJ95778.1 hypothetical protein Prum_094200 [Phytohabitans rumicis]
MDEPVRLAVDLGTTHTVAVVRRGGQEPRTLLFDGTPLLSSGVFVDAAGTIHTGRDGQRLGAAEPERYDPHPKRRVDEGTVLLGEHEVPVEQLLAAGLRRVADEARTAGVSPQGATVLTCPADWGQPRRNVLRAAAWQAGLGQVRLLDEPIAAATYCMQVLGQQVPPGGCLGVFDFGGGTFDVAVVRREPAGLRVLATGGLDDLGGLDVDNALVAHLGQLVGVRDPYLWQRLDRPLDGEQRRERAAFWAEVRAAKEMLSRASSAPVHVPGRPEPMHLTRDEVERVAGSLVARAVDETRRVLQRAGVEPAMLAGLLLVGGSSRMPLVASRLHARLGVAPSVPEQPELPVAYGALVHAMAPALGGPVQAPPMGSPAAPYPVSGPFGAPQAPYPVSAQFPVGSVSGPGPVVPPPPPPPHMGPQQPVPAPPVRKAKRRRPVRRAVLATVVFALVGCLVATVTQGTKWLQRTIDDAKDGLGSGLTLGNGDAGDTGGDGELTTVHTVPAAGTGAVGVGVGGDTAYYAVASTNSTEVVALPGGGGEPKWRKKVAMEPTGIRLTVVGDVVVLDGEDSATDGGDNARAVLAAGDGKQLWKKVWENRVDVAYLGTDAIVELQDSHSSHAVLRVDLRTGKEKWRRSGGDEVMVLDAHRIEPVQQWVGEKGGTVPALEGAFSDAFTAKTDTVVELSADEGKGAVVDAATGKAKSSGTLPLQDETWTVYAGLVIGVQNDEVSRGRDVLAAYKLPGFGRAWTLPLPSGQTVERVKPCGQNLVCAAVDADDQSRTIAVNTATGKEAWKVGVEWSDDENWYVGAAGMVFGRATFGPVSEPRILKLDGTQGEQLPDGSTVEAVQGGRLGVQSAGLVNSDVAWQVFVADVGGKATKGVNVGADPPEQMVLGGDLMAVVTKDRKILVLKIASLK